MKKQISPTARASKNKFLPFQRTILLAGCLLFAASGETGCATRTILGDLIPAHHLSDQREGEDVWIDISFDVNDKMTNANSKSVSGVAAVVAGAAVGAVIDYVKAQMQSEAARYDADFHNIAFAKTESVFGTDTNKHAAMVLLTRWVKCTPPTGDDYTRALSKVETIVTNSVASSHMKITNGNFTNRINGKSLAFAYCIRLTTSDDNSESVSRPFLIQPLWKWQWLSKAKVVSFRTWNPFSWPAGLLVKRGTEVDYEISLMLSALVMTTTNGYPQMTTIGLKDPIQANAKFDLSGTNHFELYEENKTFPVGWIAIPGYPRMTDAGYFGIGLAVKESDPSNVKTMLLQGSQYLESNKQNLINRVVGGQ